MPMIPVKEAPRGVRISEPTYKEHETDLLIVGGTSLNVWPAAGLINYFRGDRLALINKSPVARDLAAGLVITDPIGEVLSQL